MTNFVIKPGDVLFVWGHTLIEKAIEVISHGPSHMAIFVDSATLYEAQSGRILGPCPLSFYQDGKSRIEVWTDPTLTDDERQKMVEFAKSMEGTHYDYFLIPLELAHFSTGINIEWFRENQHVICSTFANNAPRIVGKEWSPLFNVAPRDVLTCGKLELGICLYPVDTPATGTLELGFQF